MQLARMSNDAHFSVPNLDNPNFTTLNPKFAIRCNCLSFAGGPPDFCHGERRNDKGRLIG